MRGIREEKLLYVRPMDNTLCCLYSLPIHQSGSLSVRGCIGISWSWRWGSVMRGSVITVFKFLSPGWRIEIMLQKATKYQTKYQPIEHNKALQYTTKDLTITQDDFLLLLFWKKSIANSYVQLHLFYSSNQEISWTKSTS